MSIRRVTITMSVTSVQQQTATRSFALFIKGLFFTATLLLCLIVSPVQRTSAATIEDFESRTGTVSALPGASIANAQIGTAGVEINDFEAPAHSGVNSLYRNRPNDPIVFTLLQPVAQFSFFATYDTGLQVSGWDHNGMVVATTSGKYDSNLLLSGDPGDPVPQTNVFGTLRAAPLLQTWPDGARLEIS